MAVTVQLQSGSRTPRHEHAARLVFEVILGLEWRWVETDGKVVMPHSELLASEVRLAHPPSAPWKEWALPFVQDGQLDPFALAFWMATRMEEWGEGARDDHGRFLGANGWAARHGVLERPVLEEVVREWAQAAGLPAPTPRPWTWWATVDVDNAFAYRHKPVWRKVAGFVRDGLRRDWAVARERWAVLSGQIPDPFDTYDALLDFHEASSTPSRFFFLLADRGPHDEGIAPHSKGLATAIRHVATRADVGIHPGHASHGHPDRIRRETERLETILGQSVRHTRQHYLLHDAPRAWPALAEAGLAHDWSHGFHDAIGYRAGLARPFPAYDLGTERPLTLTVHPVNAMETTLARYMALPANAATLQRVWDCAAAARAVDGEFVTLWHNETYAGRGEWSVWREFYQTLLQERPETLR